jgi:hypothetical protein
MMRGPIPMLWSRGRSVAPTTTGSALESCRPMGRFRLLIRRGEAALRFDHRPASGSALGPGSDGISIYLTSDAAHFTAPHSRVKQK